VVNPTSTPKSKAQTQFEIKNYNELMSHLLCLNSCDNYPNKCPHICLHLTVKQHPTARGRVLVRGVTPDRGGALYGSDLPLQGLLHKYFRLFPAGIQVAQLTTRNALERGPSPACRKAQDPPWPGDARTTSRTPLAGQPSPLLRHLKNCVRGPESA
jgi:hypothetical protein